MDIFSVWFEKFRRIVAPLDSVTLHIPIIQSIIVILLFWEIFRLVLADGFLLDFMGHKVSSSLQYYSQYSGSSFYTGVWIVSICSLIYKSCSLFIKSFGIMPQVSSTILSILAHLTILEFGLFLFVLWFISLVVFLSSLLGLCHVHQFRLSSSS